MQVHTMFQMSICQSSSKLIFDMTHASFFSSKHIANTPTTLILFLHQTALHIFIYNKITIKKLKRHAKTSKSAKTRP